MPHGPWAAALSGAGAEALSAVLLAAILTAAVIRPRWLPGAAVAVPAAVIVIVTGALPLPAARTETARLLPVVGFLAAVLVLGQLCESEGLFSAAGARLARWSRHRPVRLLTGTFALASVTTAVLSLDTTVVLLTPVVHETAARLRLRPKPYVYACTHLANSASLLLPVSNLTNLADGLPAPGYGEAPIPPQRTGPSGPVSGRCLGEVPPRGREAHPGGSGGSPPGS